MKPPNKVTFGLAALFAIVAVVETATALTARRRVASADDWRAAADAVRASFGKGDLLVFAPAWADAVGRAALGDLVPVEMAGRSDADHYARIFEVSIRGARAPETAGMKPSRESRFGRVRVAVYDKSAAPALYDFTAHADEARVTQTDNYAVPTATNEHPCYRDVGTGFRCLGSRVERRTLEIDYRPRYGVLVPADGSRATHVGYSEVPLGGSLTVYAGLHDYYARKSADAPCDLAVVVDGKEILRARLGNADGWRRFDVDTRALAGRRHGVRFDVSAADPAWRNLGFHAEARP